MPAKTAALAHVANNAQFRDYRCKFTYTAGFAVTPADWFAGKYDQPPEKAEFVWAVSGSNESIRIIETPETVKMRQNEKLTPVPGQPKLMVGRLHHFITSEYIGGSSHALRVVPEDHMSWVFADAMPRNRQHIPFGFYGEFCMRGEDGEIGQLITEADTGRARLTAETVREDGRELVKLTATPSYPKQITYWLDPARGYTPVRRTKEFNGTDATTIDRTEYSEHRECSGGRWFPGRVVSFFRQKSMTRWMVKDVRVTALEADTPPPREAFVATVPAGAWIADNSDVIKRAFRARKQEKIHIDDLPTVFRMTQELPAQPLADTAIPPTPSRWRWAGWAGGLAAVALAVRFVVRRRRE